MNILFAASELSPYAKTGGLGDVLAALPTALRERGHSISCVLPLYRSVAEQLPDRQRGAMELSITLGTTTLTAPVHVAKTREGVKLFLIEQEELFDRSHLDGTVSGDYRDNAGRFIFFSKAVVELARYLSPLPEILHVHDWQVGLVPALVRAGGLPFRTVYTIHNLAYQGSFWGLDFDLCNLPGEYFTPAGVEFYQRLNCMKAGIVLADQVTTVSPHYAQEIQTPEFGCGLEGVLLENQTKLTGILNGVNDQLWDPATDPHLKANYDAHDLTGKEKCKRHLLKTMGLEDTNAPLFGLVSRLAEQKGIDLIAEAMDEFLEQDVRLIVLGSGDPAYEDYFQKLAKQYPDKVAVQIGFDEALAHQIEAGADFFLMPSRFEPCGLNQMYSLRYGTLPIVHDTGGLSDSVVDEPGKTQTGFKFRGYTLSEFQEALRRALVAYSDSQQLWTLRREAMKQKFSWDVSAAHYENVYRKALRVPI